MYKIVFLEIAQKDAEGIFYYITHTLKAPRAAMDLLDKFEKSILTLEKFPYAHALYRSQRPLNKEYRKLLVNNYAIYYLVQEAKKTVEIQRILYIKRDLEVILD